MRNSNPQNTRIKRDRFDALRILVALVFIALAAASNVDRDPEALTVTQTSVNHVADERAGLQDETRSQEKPSWASLLLRALQRIV